MPLALHRLVLYLGQAPSPFGSIQGATLPARFSNDGTFAGEETGRHVDSASDYCSQSIEYVRMLRGFWDETQCSKSECLDDRVSVLMA